MRRERAIVRQNQQTVGRAGSELVPAPPRPSAASTERHGIPLLPVRRPDAIVTLDIVNALRDESP